MMTDYPIIYRVLTIPGGAGFLSINSMGQYIYQWYLGPKTNDVTLGKSVPEASWALDIVGSNQLGSLRSDTFVQHLVGWLNP